MIQREMKVRETISQFSLPPRGVDNNKPVVIDIATDINIVAPLAWELSA